MNFDDKEKLSQLMDGEWQDLNATQSVAAACADDELSKTWSRYHLIRDVMRNEKISIDMSLTSRISQAIEDEPVYSNITSIAPRTTPVENHANDDLSSSVNAGAEPSPKRWSSNFGGAALAASVAVATVFGLSVWQQAPNTGATPQTIASTPVVELPGVVLPEVEFVSNKGAYWVTPEAKRSAVAESRLNMMLSNHIERSATAERSGMLPYSRLVGYDSVSSAE